MKTTININLSGMSFCIDQDAYDLLHDYLKSVEKHLSSDTDKSEVMKDIEARIAELFSEVLRRQKCDVVSSEIVQAVINQMGKPDDFNLDEEPESITQKSMEYAKSVFRRKLYRDADNQIIAGVCSGLAKWLGIDAIWIRLLFVIFLFFWGFTAIVYCILWIVMPEAKTMAQKLEMRGEEPTISNIERELDNQNKTTSTERGGCANFLVTLLKICVWLVGGFVLFILSVTLFAVLMGLLGGMTGLVAMSPFGMFATLFADNKWLTIALIILLLLAIGIPIFGLIYSLVKYFKNGERTSPQSIWITFIIWFLSLVGCVGIGAYQIVNNADKLADWEEQSWRWLITENEKYGIEETKQISTAPWHSVEIRGAAKVELCQSDQQYLDVTSKNFDSLKIEVTDSVLSISTSHRGEEIVLFTPELKNITLQGAAELTTDSVFETQDLTISAYGASDIDVEVVAQKLDITAAGASKIELEGRAQTFWLNATGASSVDARKMKVGVGNLSVAGASTVKANASDTLRATATGMSKIEYQGNPVLEKQTNGGSRIERK